MARCIENAIDRQNAAAEAWTASSIQLARPKSSDDDGVCARCTAPVGREGSGNTATDYDVRIEDSRVGAGLRIKYDRPIQHQVLWSLRAVLAAGKPFSH